MEQNAENNIDGNTCKAWVLPIANDMNVAVGEFEMIHIISEWLRFYTVPHSPTYCNKILIWQGQLVPVFDINLYIKSQYSINNNESAVPDFVCIVAYRAEGQTKTIQFGAVSLSALPYKVDVTDELFCGYPDEEQRWASIALSCFQHAEYGPTPIVDLQRIYCPEPFHLDMVRVS